MTDHGGAASPRTEEVARIVAVIAPLRNRLYDWLHADHRIDQRTAEALYDAGLRAAQEAPAPEGLRRIVKRLVAIAAGHTPQSAGDHNLYTLQLGERFIEEAREALRATPPTPAEPPQDEAMCHQHGGWHHHSGFEHAGEDTRQHPAADHSHRAEARPPEGLDAAQVAVLQKALAIGSISHDGDGWFAKDAGYDYDDAEATLIAARRILADLAACHQHGDVVEWHPGTGEPMEGIEAPGSAGGATKP